MIGLLQFDRRDLPNQPIIICQFNSEELLDGDVFIFAVWSVAFINCPMLLASEPEDGHHKWETDGISVKHLPSIPNDITSSKGSD